MGLVSKTAKVKWHSSNKKCYKALGYIFTKYGDEFEVDVNDLSEGSSAKVECFCNNCKKQLIWSYSDYNRQVKEDGKTYCNKCARKLYGGENNRKTKLKNSKSFCDWCIDNDRQDVLDRWDYELNGYSPKDISYGTDKKMWFKCKVHPEHKSELKNIKSFTNGRKGSMDCKQCNSFAQWCIDNDRQDVLDRWDYELNKYSPWEVSYGTNKKMWFKCKVYPKHKSELKSVHHFINGQEGSIECNQCNSIAQYILDNFPNKKIEEVWDYEKNGDLDPWSVNRGSHIKIWIKCQEKDYHGSYETIPHNFHKGVRCSFCKGIKVHPLDSLGQYVIDNYGEEFLWCVWSNKNDISPFEVSIHSGRKVWWNCTDDKHDCFKRNCNYSVNLEFRCSECVKEKGESIIEEKTRLYLEELDYEVRTEYKCSLIPYNPKTNYPLPFDNEIILKNGKHLIIEVHGGQHYKICGYTRTEEELEYQQWKDKYKKDYCIQAGYEYLEIPYTAFDNKETYKKLIDDKIKNILDK